MLEKKLAGIYRCNHFRRHPNLCLGFNAACLTQVIADACVRQQLRAGPFQQDTRHKGASSWYGARLHLYLRPRRLRKRPGDGSIASASQHAPGSYVFDLGQTYILHLLLPDSSLPVQRAHDAYAMLC